MSNPTLIKNFRAAAAIAALRIVKFDAADDDVVQAAAATDAMFGVCVQPDGAAAVGDRVDVVVQGIAEVEFGGNVTRGALVTADAAGKAVAAAPAQGVNNRILGVALRSYASGDHGKVLLAPGIMQGA